MARVIIGAVPAAIAMFILGFIFYASPLAGLATKSVDNTQAAQLQSALGANLPASGTYQVPDAATPEQTVMYGQGPIATVHYNTSGFSPVSTGSLVGNLVLNLVVALLIGAALIGIDRRVQDFGSRARVAVIIAVASSAYIHLVEPIQYHHDWGHFIYRFIADSVILSAAGLIIARWFLPHARSAPAHAPTDV
jgi:hypothetical protein